MKKQTGFTLIELMIVVAIVAVLAAIALPAYQKYTAKAKFTEVVSATGPLKQQVELCYFDTQNITLCDNAATGAGWKINNAGANNATNGFVASVTVTDGVITATAVGAAGAGAVRGLEGQQIILTPTAANGAITWAITGTCKTDSLC